MILLLFLFENVVLFLRSVEDGVKDSATTSFFRAQMVLAIPNVVRTHSNAVLIYSCDVEFIIICQSNIASMYSCNILNLS